MKPWVHTANDGRGYRDVYLNGELVRRVLYADERRGLIRVAEEPVRLERHRNRDRVITRTLRGEVKVVVRSETPGGIESLGPLRV